MCIYMCACMWRGGFRSCAVITCAHMESCGLPRWLDKIPPSAAADLASVHIAYCHGNMYYLIFVMLIFWAWFPLQTRLWLPADELHWPEVEKPVQTYPRCLRYEVFVFSFCLYRGLSANVNSLISSKFLYYMLPILSLFDWNPLNGEDHEVMEYVFILWGYECSLPSLVLWTTWFANLI